MVRKIRSVLVVLLVLICAVSTSAQASTHSIYDNGNLSTTYITYFKDILSGSSFNDNYIAFRSGQYSYSLIVGEIEYNNNSFTSNNCKEYVFSQTGNYNSQYTYQVKELNNFSLDTSNQIIYSDLGDYPQLVERGSKYEFLSAVVLFVALFYVIIVRIFDSRKCGEGRSKAV